MESKISSLKEKIAKNFLTDSLNYLRRFDILFEESLNSQMGMRCKLYLELRFSAECALKALYLLTKDANDTEIQELYKQIISHDLCKLMQLLDDDIKKEVNNYISQVMIDFPVDNRYVFEANRYYRPQGVLFETYSMTIANPHFMQKERENIDKLLDYIKKEVKVPVEHFGLDDISTNKMEKENKIISSLKKRNSKQRLVDKNK